MEVFRGVLVWGTVTAADVAAYFAQPQMHPTAADLQTVLAPVSAGSYVGDLVYVFAVLHRGGSLILWWVNLTPRVRAIQ